jgi:fructokinase
VLPDISVQPMLQSVLPVSYAGGRGTEQAKSSTRGNRQSVHATAVGDMAAKKFTVVGLGEVLWDIFPEGKQLGGAPANFAHITNLLGDHGIVASRIGNDIPGKRAVDKLSRIGLDITFLQFDFALPTGTVQVSVNKEGEPNYKIADPVAWDRFEWTREWKALARRADAVCFGSLAQRAPQSRATVQEFLKAMDKNAARVFDVNLRQAFYSPEVIAESLKIADVVKLNQEELRVVAEMVGIPHTDDRASAQRLLQNFQLELVCVTRGANGSILCSEKECDVHPGFHIKVTDMVGAGDAFTAGLIRHYLRKSPLAKMNDAANRLGAWVASQKGAMPTPGKRQLKKVHAAIA